MLLDLFIVCACVFCLHVYLGEYYVCAWCLWRSEEGVGSPGIGVRDGFELPWGSWESILGPVEEHPILVTAKSSLQTPFISAL